MAARKRNPVEVEADRLFLVDYFRHAGPDATAVDAAAALNAKRADVARKVAEGAGLTPTEIETAARDAQLSVQSVRRDVRIVVARLRAGADVSAAAWIDHQIEECQADLVENLEMTERVLGDLERSRERTWSRTRGAAPAAQDGAPRPRAVPTEVTTHREDREASAALYRVVLELSRRRSELRQEMRTLRFGKIWLPEADDSQRELVAAIGKASGDPQAARELAVKLYAAELEEMTRAQEYGIGPGSADDARRQAGMIAIQKRKLELVQNVIDVAGGEEGDEDRGFRFEVEVVSPEEARQ